MLLSNSREIYLHRVFSGLSIRQLAEISKLNVATISKIERERKKVSPKTAKRLSDALKVPMDSLFEIILDDKGSTEEGA